jgi:hypothetical protein
MSYDSGAYEFNWPPHIFAAEAAALVEADIDTPSWPEAVAFLLDEAFTGERPSTDCRPLSSAADRRAATQFLRRLIEDSPSIRQAAKLHVDQEPDKAANRTSTCWSDSSRN